MKPLLPGTERVMPYLKRIDAAQWYSNSGPLVMEFEDRLADLFGLPVVTASSATSALTASLMALGLPDGGKVAVPSWTFCATVNAIIAAGYVPVFVDIDIDGFIHPEDCSMRVDAVVVVAAFGYPINMMEWQRWSDRSGMPVVIDASAGFDSFSRICKPGNMPVVISTHCTKVFGTGEGGFVVCSDKDFAKAVRVICNNGFTENRVVMKPGINAKMSEYHAAIGLAELDGWEEKRGKWLEIQKWYADPAPFASSTGMVGLCCAAAPIVEKLERKGIRARVSWYGCHRYPAFKKYMGLWGSLPMTDEFIRDTIFLPKYIGMSQDLVQYILSSLHEVVCE